MELSLLTFAMIPDAVSGALDAEGLCRAVEKNGIDKLDLMTNEVQIYGEETLKGALCAHNITCDCMITCLPFFKDREQFSKQLDASLDLTRRMGAGTLMVIPGSGDEDICTALTRQQMLELAVEGYRTAVERASALGIKVGFENTPQDYKPLCAPKDCRYILDRVPGLGFILDTGNFRVADVDCDELAAYELLKDWIIRVHLKDVVIGAFTSGERCCNGQYIRAVTTGAGVIPIRALVERLRAEGYSGVFSVEYAAGSEVHGENHADYLATYLRNIRAYSEGVSFCPPMGSVPGLAKPVSKIVFGTAVLPMLKGENVFALLDAALASGINTFDCARGYGGAEHSLGSWIRERNNRDRVVILTKCGNTGSDGSVHIDRDVILSECSQSLEALGIDCIDIYLLHRDDSKTAVSEYIDTLNELKRAGKISVFGVSNWTVERIKEANTYAAAHGLAGFSVSSPNYGLTRQMKDPWGGGCVTVAGPEYAADRAWYAAEKMPVFAYSSLGRGFFSGRFRAFDEEGAKQVLDPFAQKGYLYPENMRRLHHAEEISQRDGCTVSQVALRYLFASEMNVFALVSISRPCRLVENIAASLAPLSSADASFLERDTDERIDL